MFTLLTVMLGFTNLFGSMVLNLIIEKFGRRSILLTGTFMIFLSLVFIIIFSSLDLITLSIILIFIHVFVYRFKLSPSSWVYLAEILPDSGVAVGNIILWIV